VTTSTTSGIVLLLAVAMGVALVARRLRVPYTVALVVAGLALGATHAVPAPRLTKDLLYAAFLPGLLFEAAFHLDLRDFRANRRAILGLAVPGVVLAVVATAAALACVPRGLGLPLALGWPAAWVFASLIAATDPIAVVALFRDLGAPHRLTVVIEGESLVNDGTAVVAFTIALGLASANGATAASAALDFARIVGLGLGTGVVLGFGISKLVEVIDDPLVDITLTTIAAYGSFVLAEQLHASGVLATVTAGLICGSYGARRGMCTTTRGAVESFWQYVAFALNSIVFLLIGLEVPLGELVASWPAIVLGYAVVMLVRGGLVYAVLGLLRSTRERMDWSWGAVLTWGGLRGALSMVLALALADGFPDRVVVVRVTLGVVLLSIVVNGLTIAPLLRRLRVLGVATPPGDARLVE
jgi:CPA1 family monovalent cation:H+ antiporter